MPSLKSVLTASSAKDGDDLRQAVAALCGLPGAALPVVEALRDRDVRDVVLQITEVLCRRKPGRRPPRTPTPALLEPEDVPPFPEPAALPPPPPPAALPPPAAVVVAVNPFDGPPW